MKTRLFSLSAILAMLGPVAVVTHAEVLVAQTRTTPAVYGGATYTVDFNGAAAGGTQFTFSTEAPNTRVVIMFNAEAACGGTAFNWLDVDILVDPAGPVGETVVSPSNGDNAFCSGNGVDSDFIYGGGDGWVSASTIGAILLTQAGVHTVRVRVDGAHCGIARLDDMSLIVMR